ncbi:hypothetical protein [Micromonospora sp. KC721]|uniref:hypothetical protein n=1 Tax=Micromonospora sp. KC721 TaxID=2530380 RepID=UPI0010459A04|nr:hypothetical protein [Micromonospora sp. KC721]TDB79486.1 hypothetical protein E1182_12495 [Micromonospora sp. KC721]
MHAHPRAPRRMTGALSVLVPALLVACTADPPGGVTPNTPPDPAPAGVDAAWDELAALAAAARDRHFTARYTHVGSDGSARDVTVVSAEDGSWRVDVSGGALGGTADVAIAANSDGLFQCGLPSAGRPEAATCVRLGGPDAVVPDRLDPRVQHPFTDWLAVLTDRRSPLVISPASPPEGVAGRCFTVESTSASLNPPLDVGVYCFAADGTPTHVRAALGTLTLAGPAGPAPATVALPGAVVDAEPLGRDAPTTTESPGGRTS